MGRRLAALCAALMIASVAPAAGEMPGAGAGVEQWADANWIVGKGSAPYYYFAMGMRFMDGPNVVTYGVVGKGKCFRDAHGMSCMAGGIAHELDATDFEFDPAFRTARLHLEADSHVNDVTWTGKGDAPQGAAGLGWSSCGLDGSLGGARLARAEGSVLGVEMTKKSTRHDFHFLLEGAAATVYTDCEKNADGTITVKQRIHIPNL